jgi:hypothetical protein
MKAIITWFLKLLQQLLDDGPAPTLPNSSDSLPGNSTSEPSTSAKATASTPNSKAARKSKPLTGAKADFQKLLDKHGIRYFTADEVFFRGARDAKLQLNSDPPRGLWPSLLAVVKVADEARHRLGKPLRITSAFRNVAYNRAIQGAVGSWHTRGGALDLSGSPATLHRILNEMRAEGLFRGGLGKYKTFVHVDVRGRNADW